MQQSHESLNSSIRKIIKTRRAFASDEAALKLIYLALQNIANHGPCRLNRGKRPLINLLFDMRNGYPQDEG